MRQLHEGDVEAARLLARLRIFYPGIAAHATLLLAASSSYNIEDRRQQLEVRNSALRDFENAARKLAADLPELHWWQWRKRSQVKQAQVALAAADEADYEPSTSI